MLNMYVKRTTVYTHVNGDKRWHIKTAKIKKVILLCCCTLTYDDVQCYSKITFFKLFSMFERLSPLTCV